LSYLPMAALAALLILVAWNMSDAKHFVHIIKVAPRSDVTVLITCYTLTVVFDMTISVTVGVVLASLLFMRRMAETSTAKLVSYDEDSTGPVQLPKGVMLYEIAGPLFFGAADKAMDAMKSIGDQTKAIVLKMGGVPIIDETGLVAFETALARLHQRKILALVTELQKQPAQVLSRAGIKEIPGRILFCNSVSVAIERAQEYVTIN
jgi:sulfate permease, SulP family